MYCHFCHKELKITGKVGRQEDCPHCGGDLHICKNCEFYDTSAYNECREPQADRVVDKEKSNFCDYFAPLSPSPFGESDRRKSLWEDGERGSDLAADAKKKLAELFKK